MEKQTIVGLSALLPVAKMAGKNTWVMKGWKTAIGREGDQEFVFILEDDRQTKPQKPGLLMTHIAAWEETHQSNLFKRADGGFNYKTPVVLEFNYDPNARGFRSPVSNINLRLKAEGQSFTKPTTIAKAVGMGPIEAYI